MADRRVRCTGKTSGGTITSLGNSGETWSPRSKADAISDINAKTHTYYVNEANEKTEVKVKGTAPNQYLETVADTTHANNLGKLPNC